jgi:2-methylisocitrate lyase-like PEP mutase family enzyme
LHARIGAHKTRSMNDLNARQLGAVRRFRALHASGCFVIPNPWDIGSAVFLEHLGFEAIATTSAGVSFARGLPDRLESLSMTDVLDHVRELADATRLPLNADFQNGYAHDPEEVGENVARCVSSGCAGLSIEDATGNADTPLYEARLAVERIRAARAAIDASGVPVVLTARCEAVLLRCPDAERIVIDRLVAFADAGADCLYAPAVREPERVAEIVNAVAPRAVNVLMAAPSQNLTVRVLEDLGVRRVSVGSALARVAWGAFIRAARRIKDTGSFDAFADGASFAELDAVFLPRATCLT